MKKTPKPPADPAVERYSELLFSALRTRTKFKPSRVARFKGPLPGCPIQERHASSDCAYCLNIYARRRRNPVPTPKP